jgi:hypothetical protein
MLVVGVEQVKLFRSFALPQFFKQLYDDSKYLLVR